MNDDNLGRVRRLAVWKVAATEGFEGILREFETRIEDVAIDSVRHRLYIQFKEPPQFLSCPAGICVFDQAKGTFQKHIAFPSYRADDGRVRRCPTWKGTVFDFERQRCYVNAWMNNRLGVASIDIEGAATRIIHRELRLARWPILDERRLLLTSSEVAGPQAVAFLDLDSLKIDGPVLEFGETRLFEGSGICFHALTPKTQARGFVTFDDMRSAAQKNPALVAKARAFQQAFAMGVAKGIAEGAGEPSSEQPFAEVKPPAYLEGYEEFWKWGRIRGFSYGKQLSATKRGILSGEVMR